MALLVDDLVAVPLSERLLVRVCEIDSVPVHSGLLDADSVKTVRDVVALDETGVLIDAVPLRVAASDDGEKDEVADADMLHNPAVRLDDTERLPDAV